MLPPRFTAAAEIHSGAKLCPMHGSGEPRRPRVHGVVRVCYRAFGFGGVARFQAFADGGKAEGARAIFLGPRQGQALP